LEVDCRGIFKPGQLGVALGRACTSEGLRVINFKKKFCIKQPAIVLKFLQEESSEFLQDTSCCRTKRYIKIKQINIPSVEDYGWLVLLV
jgi:hypothetical protein